MGLTFKENCPDIRNSKVEDIIIRLKEYGIIPLISEPWVNKNDAMKEYGVALTSLDDISDVDCIILAVAHNEFKKMSLEDLDKAMHVLCVAIKLSYLEKHNLINIMEENHG